MRRRQISWLCPKRDCSACCTVKLLLPGTGREACRQDQSFSPTSDHCVAGIMKQLMHADCCAFTHSFIHFPVPSSTHSFIGCERHTDMVVHQTLLAGPDARHRTVAACFLPIMQNTTTHPHHSLSAPNPPEVCSPYSLLPPLHPYPHNAVVLLGRPLHTLTQ